MDKYYYIDELLKQYIDYYKNNPDVAIDEDVFYSGLANYGMTQQEYENRNIEHYFDIWVNHFKNHKNLNVYRDERQWSFLQFRNNPMPYAYPNAEYVKLYASFNKEALPECVIRIFEFVEKNNMISCSKISKSVRSDSVVLRLGSIEDAEKVINFINNDEFLVANSKNLNPFVHKEGIVGMGFDGMLSFNCTVALLLEEYFKEGKRQGCMDYLNAENFKSFVKFYKEKLLSSPSELKSFLAKNGDYSRFDTEGEMANNYIQVIELIEKSLDKDFSFEDYKETFEKFSSEMKDRSINSSYERFMQSANDISYDTIELEKEILDAYIKLASIKYGKNDVILYLGSYMAGNKRAITRDNDFRDKFEKYLSREKIIQITNNNLIEYIDKVLNEVKQNEAVNDENITEHYNQFYNACMQTYLKYDAYQLQEALRQAQKGNYGYFTNSNGNSRDYLKNNFNPEILNKCMAYLGYVNGANTIESCLTVIQNDAVNFGYQTGSQNKAM